MILVDTDVLLDVLEEDAEWSDWSQDQLDAASATDNLAINAIIYSELSIGFSRIEELEAVITEASLAVEDIPREALFLAGRAFLRYRCSRGPAVAPANARCGALSNLFPDSVAYHAVIDTLGPPESADRALWLTRPMRPFKDVAAEKRRRNGESW
jgi:predicted nucleic acid-binding protein